MHYERNQAATDVRELAEKVRRLASEQGLVSYMNDTKWREVCRTFSAMSPLPQFRISDMLAKDGYVSDWDGEWYHHPYPYVSVRWLEVRLSPMSVPVGSALCVRIGAPAELTPHGIRIWGWATSDDAARFSK